MNWTFVFDVILAVTALCSSFMAFLSWWSASKSKAAKEAAEVASANAERRARSAEETVQSIRELVAEFRKAHPDTPEVRFEIEYQGGYRYRLRSTGAKDVSGVKVRVPEHLFDNSEQTECWFSFTRSDGKLPAGAIADFDVSLPDNPYTKFGYPLFTEFEVLCNEAGPVTVETVHFQTDAMPLRQIQSRGR